MKLSKLTYLAVKNVVYLDDEGFTYEAFITGEYDNNLDYATNINNVFAPINKAIHRLSDRDKLPTKIYYLPQQNSLEYSLADIKQDLNNIKNVFYFQDGDYCSVDFRTFGLDKLILINAPINRQYIVEYVPDLPHFDREMYRYYYDEELEKVVEVLDIDLKDYGITDIMVSYIMDYVKGALLEVVDPNLAMVYLNRAEEYMEDLKDYSTHFNQKKVKKVYRI